MQNNEKGVALILELILVALVAGIIAIVGYRAYQTHPNPQVNTQATNQTTTKQPEPGPYAGWKSYKLPVEGAFIKYPSNWKFTGSSHRKGECAPATNCDNNAAVDLAVVTSPNGLEVGIGSGNTAYVARHQGSGCIAPMDTCVAYQSEPVNVVGKDVFLTITGYAHSGESIELGLAPFSDCIQFCRQGLGAGKVITDPLEFYATHPAVYNITSNQFINDPEVATAKLIARSIHY